MILPASAPLTGSIVVPLKRTDLKMGSRTEASFYTGDVSIGFPPQTLSVVFDTSSGNVLLPHRACRSPSCLEHHRYSPWESLTAIDVRADGRAAVQGHRYATRNMSRDGVSMVYTQSDLGEGEVQTVIVRDNVCVGDEGNGACVDMSLMAAVKMEDKPFRRMPCDGIVGLGMEGLSQGPMSSYFARLMQGSSNVVPHFGLVFGVDAGELHIGGHNLARIAHPLRWFPVDHPQQGLWQVAIQAVRVGNSTVDDCRRGCHGVVDSGVSRLGVQANRMPQLQAALTSVLSKHHSCQGPDLTFDLGGMSLTLSAQDYAGSNCQPMLGPLDLEEPEFVGVYTLGALFLRQYYAAFDWENQKVGFAPLHSGQESVKSSSLPENLEGILLV
jgi:cathepsin D